MTLTNLEKTFKVTKIMLISISESFHYYSADNISAYG